MTPSVSVIIRQHNEFQHLQRLFETIRNQSLQDIEIVVVDSGSTDGSRELAARYADQVVDIPPHDFTFGYSLNMGIRAARSNTLIIVSAHTYPTSQAWASTLIAPLKSSNVCMTYGRQIGSPASNPAEQTDFDRYFGPHPRIQKAPHYFCNNANSAIRKDLWEKRPFDESLSGLEDMEWSRHFLDQGMELHYVPEAEIVHIHNESPAQIHNRFYREALALRRMGIRRRYHLPRDIFREIKFSLADLSQIKGSRSVGPLSYRYNKIIGHVRGILKGRKDEAPLSSDLRKILDVSDNLSVVVQGPNNVALINRPIPDLAPTEVLIQPAYVGICGTDREISEGSLGYYRTGVGKYPIVLGHEYSGVVARVGSKVTSLAVGDRVVGECILTCGSCSHCASNHRLHCRQRKEVGVLEVDGALASFVKVSALRVHRIPTGVSLRKGALAEPSAVVVHALKVGEIWEQSSKKIAILGAGSLGHLAAKILLNRGYKGISVVEKSSHKLSLLEHPEIQKHHQVSKDLLESVDVVIDFTGHGGLLKETIQNLRAESTLILVGFPYHDGLLDPETIVARQLQVRGSLGAQSADFKDALTLLETLDVQHHTQDSFPISAFQDAFYHSRHSNALKTTIVVHPPLAEETS